MTKLFMKTKINSMTIANRFVRSATWENMASPEGFCTPQLTNCMVNLAYGGVGLIITGDTIVTPDGRARIRNGQLALYNDSFIKPLSDMTTAVHNAGGIIVMQLNHTGCQAKPSASMKPMGPSIITEDGKPLCRAMSKQDIDNIVKSFGDAAVRAKRAGFDGVQLHAAHGYLLSQFLSPFYNKRTDNYGGSIENRARIVIEIFDTIRKRTSDDFPILIKINSEDFLENGFTINDMLSVAAMLEKKGIGVIELSGGTKYSKKHQPVPQGNVTENEEGYYKKAAKEYKKTIKVPLLITGGIRSYNVAEKFVTDGLADYIGLSRPLIREPDLIKRWQAGNIARARCVYCNQCINKAINGAPLRCQID